MALLFSPDRTRWASSASSSPSSSGSPPRPRVARLEDPALSAEYHFWLGRTFSVTGFRGRAVASGEQALAEARRADDRTLIGRAHYVSATSAISPGRSTASATRGGGGASARHPRPLLACLRALGAGAQPRPHREFDAALEAIARVMEVADATQDPSSRARRTGRQAPSSRAPRRLGPRRRGGAPGSRPLTEPGQYRALAMGFLGAIYFERRRGGGHVPLLEKAVAQLGRSARSEMQAWMTSVLGEARRRRGELDTARAPRRSGAHLRQECATGGPSAGRTRAGPHGSGRAQPGQGARPSRARAGRDGGSGGALRGGAYAAAPSPASERAAGNAAAAARLVAEAHREFATLQAPVYGASEGPRTRAGAWPTRRSIHERRHQHPVHPLLGVLLAADRDHRGRLSRRRKGSSPSTRSRRRADPPSRGRGGHRACLPVGAVPGLRPAREGPGAARRALRADQREGRLLSHRPRARSRLQLGEARAARPCWWITAASRSPCSSTRCHRARPRLSMRSKARGRPRAARWTRRSARATGDYIHQQGPAPQQLEHDGVGHVVASVGEAIGPVAFSSLAATRDWLRTDAAHRFMRAYRKARAWLLATPAARGGRDGGQILSGDRPGGADFHHRLLPEARLLDAARGDHPPGLRDGAGRIPARGTHHQTASLRGRGGGAARVLTRGEGRAAGAQSGR